MLNDARIGGGVFEGQVFVFIDDFWESEVLFQEVEVKIMTGFGDGREFLVAFFEELFGLVFH